MFSSPHRARATLIWVALLGAAICIPMAYAVWRESLNFLTPGIARGERGLDYFSLPRGWINLRHGVSMFRTSASSYGPWASVYLSHPVFVLVLGPVFGALLPWHGYTAFVALSLVLLTLTAVLIAAVLPLRSVQLLTPPLLICSIPTYLMLWNAQPQIFLILALALVFIGIVRLGTNTKGAQRDLAFGLLLSLFTKPLVLMMIPALFSLRAFRKTILLVLAVYVVVSALCVITPAINPERVTVSQIADYVRHGAQTEGLIDNVCHWFSIVRQQATIDRKEPELFGFPNFVRDSYGQHIPLWVFRLPLLITLALSFLNMCIKRQGEALRNALLLCICVVASHFLGYTLVWEYHYTMLLVIVPFLVVFWREAPAHSWERRMYLLAAVSSFALYLPTPYCFFRENAFHHLTLLRLPRVGPAVAIYGCLTLVTCLRMVREFRGQSQSDEPSSYLRSA